MVNKFTARALFLVSLFCLLVGGGKAYAGTLGSLVDFSTLNNYSPNGAAWKSNFTIDWNTQYLEIVIDATNCTDADNIFTLTAEKVPAGNRVDWWGTYEGSKTGNSDLLTKPARVHAYYKSSYINFYRFVKDSDDKTNPKATGVTSSNKSYIVFKVSKADGLQATIGTDGTAQTVCSASDLTDDFFAADMTIGSEEGGTRMHGTYTSVAIKNIGGTPVPPTPTDAVITNTFTSAAEPVVVENEFVSTASTAWNKDVTIDWNKYNLEVTIDFNGFDYVKSSCVLAVASKNTNLDWNTNCSIAYREGNNVVRGYVPNTPSGSGDNNYGDTSISGLVTKFVYSKANGLTIDGVVKSSATLLSDLFSTSEIHLGSTSQAAAAKYTIKLVPISYTTTGNELNEAAVNTFEGQSNVKVVLKRTLVGGAWNTICLPFNVKGTDLATALGTTCDLRTFGNVSGTTVNFATVQNIAAGQPYLIRPEAEVVNPTFEGVDIVAGEPSLNKDGEFGMKGTYGLTTLATDGTNLFLAADNSFLEPEADKAVMKGMRAYFIVPAGTPAAALRANIDGVETSIDAIDATETVADTTVYNLQGQRVGNTLQGLPRGLYIQNGKKVVVK